MTNEKSKALCVICNIHLDKIDDIVFLCSKCKRKYIGEYEIMSFENDVGTPYDDVSSTIELEGIGGASSPIMETKKENNEYLSILDSEKHKTTDIKIPKYMQNSETTKVIEYDER